MHLAPNTKQDFSPSLLENKPTGWLIKQTYLVQKQDFASWLHRVESIDIEIAITPSLRIMRFPLKGFTITQLLPNGRIPGGFSH